MIDAILDPVDANSAKSYHLLKAVADHYARHDRDSGHAIPSVQLRLTL